jgi:hypothetical protein
MGEPFQFECSVIDDGLFDAMRGNSWRDDPRCPRRAELAVLRMTHWTFAGTVEHGELVVARSVGDELESAFAALFAARFPIARMRPIHHYGGDDGASMAANNCSAFNFRVIAGTDRLSQHALGMAVDINPVQNPWVRGERVLPAAGADYVQRDGTRPGVIVRPGVVVDAFAAIGWSWGGDWPETHDYHHFQKFPRRGA